MTPGRDKPLMTLSEDLLELFGAMTERMKVAADVMTQVGISLEQPLAYTKLIEATALYGFLRYRLSALKDGAQVTRYLEVQYPLLTDWAGVGKLHTQVLTQLLDEIDRARKDFREALYALRNKVVS